MFSRIQLKPLEGVVFQTPAPKKKNVHTTCSKCFQEFEVAGGRETVLRVSSRQRIARGLVGQRDDQLIASLSTLFGATVKAPPSAW